LWTALLGLHAMLPGAPLLWAKLAGIAAQAASVLLVFTVARRLDLSPRRAAVAAALVAVSDWLVWSALSGMEVNLFVLLMLAGLARHLRERAAPPGGELPPLSFLLFALAALARPEGLLLPLLAAADRLLRLAPIPPSPPIPPSAPRASGTALVGEENAALRLEPPARPAWIGAGAGLLLALLVLAPVAFVFHDMSGSYLPTTVAAKSAGPAVLLPDIRLLAAIAGILLASQPWMTLLALGGVVESVRRMGGPRDRGLLLAAWTVALPLASAMLSSGRELAVGNFGRYFFPLLPCVVLLGSLALASLPFSRLRSVAVGRRGRARIPHLPIGALLLLLLFAPSLLLLASSLGRYLTSCANVRDSNVAMARWLAPRLPAEAVLAVNDVGAFKYLLPNRVLDLVGLMTPELTRKRHQASAQGRGFEAVLVEFLEERRPDFVLVFPSWFAYPERHPESFRRLHSIAIRDNITMGGEMIALYDTPWTRQPLAAVAESAAEPPPTESP
jgi:hypothetical protein